MIGIARPSHGRSAATVTRPLGSGLALLAGLLLLTSCGVPDAPVPRNQPPGREADGLLGDPELQDVVELQVRRDGRGLTELLAHPRARVRARAAFALGSVQDPAAVPSLVQALSDPVAAVRTDAAFALGQISDSALALSASAPAPALARALASETDPATRRSIVEALGKVGGVRQIERLADEIDPERDRALALALSRSMVLGVTSRSAVDRLVAFLSHPDPVVRRNAAWFFGRTGNARSWYNARRDLRQTLREYDVTDPAAMHLIKALGSVGDRLSEPLFLRWISKSPDWRNRVAVATAVSGGGFGFDQEIFTAIMGAMEDPSVHVRTTAATYFLGQPQDEATLEHLVEVIRSRPDDWQTATPVMQLAAGLGRADLVVSWVQGLDLDDVPEMTAALLVLGGLAGEGAVRSLALLATSPRGQVARGAYRDLAGRWRGDQNLPETHAIYREVFTQIAREGNEAVREGAASLLEEPPLAEGSVPEPAGGEAVEAEAETAPQRGPGSGVGERPQRPALDWERLRRLGAYPRLVLETERGEVVLALSTEEAPLTVQVITGLAEAGRYDGVPFHRVVPNFVAQAGDFSQGPRPDDPPVRILGEYTRIAYVRGVVGMARTPTKDTEGSQFFITHSMQPHLDGAYTSFGWVVEGMEVVDRIRQGDRILSARVEATH